jgi:hypothetical protein
MQRISIGVVLIMAAAVIGPARAGEDRDLFNGTDLEGWVVEGPDKDRDGHPMWRVEDGRIVCLGRGYGFLRYDRESFGDFALRVEYRFAPPSKDNPRGNSGIGIRTGPFDPKRSGETRPSYASYEIQLLDDADKAPDIHSSGSLYRYKAPTAGAVRPAPEWNVVEIECVGPHIRVTLNGQTVQDVDQTTLPDMKEKKPATAPAPADKPLKGSVCLQSHSGQVEFRKVQIRPITPGATRD